MQAHGIFIMELKVKNTIEDNCQCIDNLYRSEIIKLLEKIDHVTTLGSIAKLGLKPVNVSVKIQTFFQNREDATTWILFK